MPRSLVERLVATIEVHRAIGLSVMLVAARSLLELDVLEGEDLKRLTETISEIRREVRYEDVALDTMKAVSASLVRSERVRPAAALKDRVADGGSLQAWVDEANRTRSNQNKITAKSTIAFFLSFKTIWLQQVLVELVLTA